MLLLWRHGAIVRPLQKSMKLNCSIANLRAVLYSFTFWTWRSAIPRAINARNPRPGNPELLFHRRDSPGTMPDELQFFKLPDFVLRKMQSSMINEKKIRLGKVPARTADGKWWDLDEVRLILHVLGLYLLGRGDFTCNRNLLFPWDQVILCDVVWSARIRRFGGQRLVH